MCLHIHCHARVTLTCQLVFQMNSLLYRPPFLLGSNGSVDLE